MSRIVFALSMKERTYGSENISSKRDDQEDMENGENSL